MNTLPPTHRSLFVKCAFLFMILSGWSVSESFGQTTTIPPIVESGFAALRRGGPVAALDRWLDGSAKDTDEAFQDVVAARMSRVRTAFGSFLGFEPIRVVEIAPSLKRIYTVVKYEKGVAYMAFDSYKNERDWIVTRISFETNANTIFPPNILGGQ